MRLHARGLLTRAVIIVLSTILISSKTGAGTLRCCESHPHSRPQSAGSTTLCVAHCRGAEHLSALIGLIAGPVSRWSEAGGPASRAAGDWWSSRTVLEKSLIVGAAAAAVVTVGLLFMQTHLEERTEKETRSLSAEADKTPPVQASCLPGGGSSAPGYCPGPSYS